MAHAKNKRESIDDLPHLLLAFFIVFAGSVAVLHTGEVAQLITGFAPMADNSQVYRAFASGSVLAGSTLGVNITFLNAGNHTYYAIEEYLPHGWTYINGVGGDTQNSSLLKWYYISNTTDAPNITYVYTARVPTQAATYTFSGVYWIEGMSAAENTEGSKQVIVIADNTPPAVSLISPANNSANTASATISLTYNVSDLNGINNCTLFVDGSRVQTSTSVTKNIPQTFTQALSNGLHIWNISCYDYAGNLGKSSRYYFTLNYQAPQPAPSSGGGSGGGGGGKPKVILPNVRSKSWFALDAGTKVVWQVQNFTINEISFVELTPFRGSSLTLTKFDKLPSFLPSPENYNAMLNFSSENINPSSVVIKFRILASAVKDIKPVLARFDGAWKELPTDFITTNGIYNYYSAISPGFSYYAIVLTKGEKPVVIESPQPPAPVSPQESAPLEETVPPTQPVAYPVGQSRPEYFTIILLLLSVIGIVGLIALLLHSKMGHQMLTKSSKKDVPKTSAPKNTVNEFIAKARSYGYNDTDIEEKLVSVGWPKNLVKEAFASLEKR